MPRSNRLPRRAGRFHHAERVIAWAEEQVGVPVSLWVSCSMGGSTSLKALLHGATPPACWYGGKPAISLEWMRSVPDGPQPIATAYDGDVPVGRNPVRNVASLPALSPPSTRPSR